MLDPDFDPLDLLYKTTNLANAHQNTIVALVESFNRVNKLTYELNKTNSMLTNKILKLEARIHAIEQASATDRQRRE